MRRLGPYQLLRKIGSGGMAEVWSARKSAAVAGADKFFAIKVLAPHLAEKEQYREMFLAEARLSMLLNHQNIVQVFDVVEDGPNCYMVMELIEGMTLSQLERGLGRRGQKLPLDVAAYVIGELLRALSYAHELELEAGSTIVHRDVSPQNVMVTTRGEVKLMDFGIARFATDDTQGAFVKGKLQYMPPEQLRKQTRRPTIDLFAVGGILHELIEGRRFRGNVEETRLLGMVLQGEIPKLEVEELPAEIDELRCALLESDEDARTPSARLALTQLYGWPGYRNAAIELEELVQNFVAPSSSMIVPAEVLNEGSLSGVPVPAAGDSAEAMAEAGDSSHTRAATTDVETSDPSAPSLPPVELHSGASQTRPSQADITPQDGVTPGDSVAFASQIRPIGWRRPALALLAGIVAVVVTVLVTLSVVKRSEERRAAEQPASSVATKTERSADDSPAKLQPSPVDKPGAPTSLGEHGAEQPAAEPTPATEPASDSEQDPADSTAKLAAAPVRPKPAEPAARKRVEVEFVANEFFFVYVKVAGRQLTLEPVARTSIPVGRHSVYLRQSKDDKWQRAGSLRLSPGKSYRVEMKKPKGLRVVEASK